MSCSSSLNLSSLSRGRGLLWPPSKCIDKVSSGSGNAFDIRKYNKHPAPNDRRRCRKVKDNIGMRVIPKTKKEFTSLSWLAFCGIDDAAKHSGPMETTLTVTITLPASARLNAIVDGLTFRFPLILLRGLRGMPPPLPSSVRPTRCSSSGSSSSSMGWQNTISAPRHVLIPAIVDRYSGVQPASVSTDTSPRTMASSPTRERRCQI